jgi:hypothetical protein
MCRFSYNSGGNDRIGIRRKSVVWHRSSFCRWRQSLRFQKCVSSPISAFC